MLYKPRLWLCVSSFIDKLSRKQQKYKSSMLRRNLEQKEFEDTKGVIRIRKSKNGQYNSQKNSV
jgi:hypothetical protein